MRQVYENYTAEDQQVWDWLYAEQRPRLQRLASTKHLSGLEKIGFRKGSIPNFDEMNDVLRKTTGWRLAVVPGIVPPYTFFELMAHKHFPATSWLRKLSELNYLESPDMFHDIFAHVPLLTQPEFVGFLEGVSRLGLANCGNEWAIERIARVYWYSVEFGLIKEQEELKIYGAGILSSAGESEYVVKEGTPREPFDAHRMMRTPYFTDGFQGRYFVLESYEQLFASLADIEFFLTRPPELDTEDVASLVPALANGWA